MSHSSFRSFLPPKKLPASGKYAVKVIRASDIEYRHMAMREYRLLRQLDHYRIIKMVDGYINQGKETIYMVMELAEGVTLKKFVKKHQ